MGSDFASSRACTSKLSSWSDQAEALLESPCAARLALRQYLYYCTNSPCASICTIVRDQAEALFESPCAAISLCVSICTAALVSKYIDYLLL